jgi:hypothetical protein
LEPLKTRHNSQETPVDSLSAGEQTLVQETLERVLASPAFRNSKQCQKFLRYVVEHSHAGNEERLKERSIGIEVFGRDPDYDTASDPVVRVRATEVRKRLAQYYGDSATGEDIRFEMPQGSYRAEIHLQTPSAVIAVPKPPVRRFGVLALVAGVLVIALVSLFALRGPATQASVIDQFWGPVIENAKPALLYCGQPVVYFLSREVHDTYRESLTPKPRGSYSVVLPPEAALKGKDIIPVTDQFVGIGNAHTAALLSGMFATRKKPVEIRYANDLSFSDLRSSPSILIGAFSNLWTMEMTGQLRFVFEQDQGTRRIRDRAENKTWQLTAIAPDGKTPEDYAIVSRLNDSASGQLLISAAGITQYGTRAAGEFLTDPARLEQTLAKTPADWSRKNLQVLLHTTIYKGTPAPPKVLATHVW